MFNRVARQARGQSWPEGLRVYGMADSGDPSHLDIFDMKPPTHPDLLDRLTSEFARQGHRTCQLQPSV